MDLIEYFLKKYKIIQKKYTHDNNNHINQYVDTIYVINLASNPVRRHYIKLMMEKMKINYTIIVVQKIHKNVYRYLLNLQHTQNKSKISQGEMGTYLSHMWCLRDAIHNNYKKFIILEDDILFHKQFHILFKQIVSEKEYDFLMLGASHFNRDANYYKPKNQVYMPSFDVLGGNLLGAFAILYTNKSATFVYELRKKNITFFDHDLYTILKQFRKSSGICYPNLIAADISHSNLNHAFSITEHTYYKKCYDTFNFQDYHFTYIDMFIKYKFNKRKDLKTTRKKALVYLLLNFFNNNGDLVKDHIKLLDWDLFSLDEINTLVEFGEKKKEDLILYKNHEKMCKIMNITPGYLLTSQLEQFRYFCLDFLPTIQKINLPDFSPQSNLETIFVEYRIFPHTEFIIRNMIIKLGTKWSHTVVCGPSNYEWMKTMCLSISSNIRIINTNNNDMTRDKYSTMLTTLKFWEHFHGEKLLLYQEDSCCFHGNIDPFLKYDLVGAPWNTKQIDYGTGDIGNGGFSLRTKQVMIDICKKYPVDKQQITYKNRNYMNLFNFTNIPEDRYFSEIMNNHKIGEICDWYEGVEFSEETYLNNSSLGGHQFWLKNHDWKTRMFKLHYEYKTMLNNTLFDTQMVKKYPYLFHKVILGITDINDEIHYAIQKEGKMTKNITSHLHCYDIDKFDHFYGDYLYEIYKYSDMVITYCIGDPGKIFKLNMTFLKIPNKGMDIGGKFCMIHYLNSKLGDIRPYILFLHSKSNNEIRKYWFDNIIANLPNIAINSNCTYNTMSDADIGGYFPPAIYSGDNSPLLWFDKVKLTRNKLEKNLYQKYHYNELYMNEIMQYLDLEENDMTCFPGGNNYILKYEVANKLFGDKYLYNILNTKSSFDFNWVKINYNLEHNDIFTVYKLKQSKELCGNNLEYKTKNKTFPDGMIEHVFERLVFLTIKSINLKISIMKDKPGDPIEDPIENILNKLCDERMVYSKFEWREKLKNNEKLLGEKELQIKLNVWNAIIK